MEPELIADYGCEVGEGPMWHPMEKRLYWVDIPTGRMFRYDPATGEHEQCYDGAPVGGFTIQEDGSFLLFMGRGAVAVWRGGDLEYVIDEIADERERQFNDVIADPMGRVFCGTVLGDDDDGRLYRLDTDGSVHKLLEGIVVSNGLGFTPDRKGMYYTESTPRNIYLFEYDVETGAISNQRVFVHVPEGEGKPDGMTVDAEGYVWSARWNGWSLVRHTPEGVEERRIRFPARQVSSMTFGGDDLTDIYVTTAGGHDKGQNGAGAGALFRLNLGIKGVPEFFSRVGL